MRNTNSPPPPGGILRRSQTWPLRLVFDSHMQLAQTFITVHKPMSQERIILCVSLVLCKNFHCAAPRLRSHTLTHTNPCYWAPEFYNPTITLFNPARPGLCRETGLNSKSDEEDVNMESLGIINVYLVFSLFSSSQSYFSSSIRRTTPVHNIARLPRQQIGNSNRLPSIWKVWNTLQFLSRFIRWLKTKWNRNLIIAVFFSLCLFD